MYLLDTNVVSELRRQRPDPAVLSWIARVDPKDLFVSAFTIGEIQNGIEMVRERDPAKAHQLEQWLNEMSEATQVLPADQSVFREWGRLMSRQPRGLEGDAVIGATARVHRLRVVTRNARDFGRLGIPVLDPFAAAA